MFQLYRVILPVNDITVAENFYQKLFNQLGNRVSSGRHYFIGESAVSI